MPIVLGDVPVPTDSNSTTKVVDINRSDRFLKDITKNFTAASIHQKLSKIISSEVHWPAVQLGDRHMSRVSDLVGEANVDGLNMLILLLPGKKLICDCI